MTQQLLPEQSEKTQQHVERHKISPASALSFQGELPSCRPTGGEA